MYNLSCYNQTSFILVGIPGLEKFHIWVGIPFCVIYVVAIVGNCILLYLIAVEQSLHEPMFIFLSMLDSTNLILSTATVPKLLGNLCIAVRSFSVILPGVFLMKQMPFCKTHFISHTYCEHIGVARLSSADISINIYYGFSVPLMTVISDVSLIAVSYIFILRAVFLLSSQGAHQKALSTCGSHVCHPHVLHTCLLLHPCSLFWVECPCSVLSIFANFYVTIPPALNPVVYGMKSKQIQDKFLLFLSLGKTQ
uniref:G-protein coupled receptors family 1 profile domain-containing protein n=1 Tax=Cricetulus griseus TaxID=10029 RepID=A0A8C2MHL0_CRIGR